MSTFNSSKPYGNFCRIFSYYESVYKTSRLDTLHGPPVYWHAMAPSYEQTLASTVFEVCLTTVIRK